jgi:hypothetical protein
MAIYVLVFKVSTYGDNSFTTTVFCIFSLASLLYGQECVELFVLRKFATKTCTVCPLPSARLSAHYNSEGKTMH